MSKFIISHVLYINYIFIILLGEMIFNNIKISDLSQNIKKNFKHACTCVEYSKALLY